MPNARASPADGVRPPAYAEPPRFPQVLGVESGLIGSVLSLGDPVEDRFDVEDGGAVNRFEVADPESQTVDGQDLDPVEADRVGRLGERVLNTPSGGLPGLSPGTVLNSSRRARSSQLTTMMCSPARRSRIPSARCGSMTSHADGAPSSPWLGASAGSVSVDSTQPMGVTSYCRRAL